MGRHSSWTFLFILINPNIFFLCSSCIYQNDHAGSLFRDYFKDYYRGFLEFFTAIHIQPASSECNSECYFFEITFRLLLHWKLKKPDLDPSNVRLWETFFPPFSSIGRWLDFKNGYCFLLKSIFQIRITRT